MRDFISIEMEAEPKTFIAVELEDHLKQGACFEELIADYVLQF